MSVFEAPVTGKLQHITENLPNDTCIFFRVNYFFVIPIMQGNTCKRKTPYAKKETDMQNPNILTIKQVAEYLKISPRTVYKLVKEGAIPSFKIMNMWRFEQSKIDQWIRNKTETNNFNLNGTGDKKHAESVDNR